MKKRTVIISFAFLLFTSLFGVQTVHAQAQESASVSADQIQKSIQDRIKKALQENLKVAQKAVNNQSAPRLRAFIGNVDSITENTLSMTVDGSSKSSKQIQVTNDTAIVIDGKANQTLSKVALNSTVIAMGYTTDNETLHAIRLVVGNIPANQYTYDSVVGTVNNIDTKAKTIDIKDAGGNANTYALAKRNNFDLKTLKTGMNVVAILITDTKGNVTKIDKLNIWQISTDTSANISPTPIASISATPTASPSAKPTTKPKKVTDATPICGDNVCNGTETPETCPVDCTKNSQ